MLPHVEVYTIRIGEVDESRQLTPFALVNLLQEAAWNHAEALGVSVYALQETGLSWVLYRLRFEIDRWPRHRETIRIHTRPSGVAKRFVYRDFYLYDEAGAEIGRATSTWLLLDISRRQMAAVTDQIRQAFEPFAGLPALPRAEDRFPSLVQRQNRWETRTRQQDIDANGHVNNAVYVQWLLEALADGETTIRRPRQVDLAFRAESVLGDEIVLWSEPTPEGKVHQFLNQENKELALARTTWG